MLRRFGTLFAFKIDDGRRRQKPKKEPGRMPDRRHLKAQKESPLRKSVRQERSPYGIKESLLRQV